MEKGDVITVMTTNGEYVGKYKQIYDSQVTIEDPRMVSLGEQGMGFANGIAMTGTENPKHVTFFNVSFVTETNPQVAAAYRQMTSGLVTPVSSGLIV